MPFWDLQARDKAVHQQQQGLQLPVELPEKGEKWRHAALFCHDTTVTGIDTATAQQYNRLSGGSTSYKSTWAVMN